MSQTKEFTEATFQELLLPSSVNLNYVENIYRKYANLDGNNIMGIVEDDIR